jgi:hypothetical protein
MNKRQFMQACALTLCQFPAIRVFAETKKESKPDTKNFFLQGVDFDGKEVNLAQIKDRTILVSFFSFESYSSMRDLKLMREFYVSNMKRKFTQVAVNIDPSKKEFDSYIAMYLHAVPKIERFSILHRHAPSYKDNFGDIAKAPTHFALDPQHQLMFKREGIFRGEDWDNLWEALDS